MAYINVENSGSQFRVILGKHRELTSASQLPEGYTGIVVEGSANIRESFFAALAGAEKYAQTPFIVQFSALRAAAQRQRKPIMAGEPLISVGALDFEESNIGIIGAFLLRRKMRFIRGLGAREDEIIKGGQDFQKAQEIIQVYKEKNPNLPINGKDLVIAERAHAFAEFQQRNGAANPNLAIVVGASHLGVVGALETPRAERITAIHADNKLKKYYDSRSLAEILYVTYNRSRDSWSHHSIVDQHLRRR